MRVERGLNQEGAAEQIGIHPKHLQRVELGIANVTFATLVAISIAFRVPLSMLFEPPSSEAPTKRPAAQKRAAPAAKRKTSPTRR
jgi:transcriptional regulator with XRE-family HTH domain